MYGIGWLLYKTVIARVQRIDPELTLVASFAVAIAGAGVIALIAGTEARAATPSYFNTSFHVGDLVVPRAQLYACIGALIAPRRPVRAAAQHRARSQHPRVRDES